MKNFYSQFMGSGDLVFDIGANMGSRTRVFADMGCRVVAVEPQEKYAKNFNLEFGSKVRLINKAVGGTSGSTKMMLCTTPTGGPMSSMSQSWLEAVKRTGRFGDHRWESELTVETTTLDALIREYGIPAFVKIDVEGYEFEVLSGLTIPLKALSYEFTPECFEATARCAKRLESLGMLEFNYSIGESMKMALPVWVSCDKLIESISQYKDIVTFGDVYARKGALQPAREEAPQVVQTKRGNGVLIGMPTCPKHADRARECLDTWIPLARAAGWTVELHDGARLGVPDDYLSLPAKTRALCRYALDHGYERMVKCDDDAFIRVDRFKLVEEDYAGIFCPKNDNGCTSHGIPGYPPGTIKFNYVSGGCYWLSKRSMEALVDAPINGEWAEDRWVGQVLGAAGIEMKVLDDFYWYPGKMPSGTDFAVVTQLAKGKVLQYQDYLLGGPPVTVPAEWRRAAVPAPPARRNPMHPPVFPPQNRTVPPQPVVIEPNADWRTKIIGTKVNQAIAKGFRVAAVCPIGSSYHMELRRSMPVYVEERIETPEGPKVLFLVK